VMPSGINFNWSFRGAGSPAAPAPRNDETNVVPILRSGSLAEEFCRRPALAEIASVFDRSFYLRSGDLFVCVGEPAIGNGPLTLIADMRVVDLGLRPGQHADVSDGRVAIGTVAFTLHRCEPWRAPRWPQAQSPILLTRVRDVVTRRAAAEAPAESFGRAIAGTSECDTALARVARTRIARFASWVSDAIEPYGAPAASLPDSVRDLVGLGAGLTPSGDDFLIGALALLDALGERIAHAILARALEHVPPGLTSPLSHCFLRTAAAGHVGEHLHRAVSSIVCGNVEGATAAIRRIGHSSGWDMMAGVLTALKIVPRDRPA